jgi:hypothetical protein
MTIPNEHIPRGLAEELTDYDYKISVTPDLIGDNIRRITQDELPREIRLVIESDNPGGRIPSTKENPLYHIMVWTNNKEGPPTMHSGCYRGQTDRHALELAVETLTKNKHSSNDELTTQRVADIRLLREEDTRFYNIFTC